MSKKKRYVVRKGKHTGIFSTWDECKAAVHGYAGAQYKSYPTVIAAQQAFDGSYDSQITRKARNSQQVTCNYRDHVEHLSIAVDAACSSNPGILERQWVETIWWKKLFSSTQYPLGTTNIGEWIAIIQGMRFLFDHERKEHTIYSDSRIALWWVQKGTIRTTLPRNSQTEKLWALIDESLERLTGVWLDLLKSKKITLIKWPTKEWWEIPADFGRK